MKLKKDDYSIISKIIDRGILLKIINTNRVTAFIDLTKGIEYFDIDVNQLYNADDFNFCHDIIGIQNNINRTTGKFENCFIPRYSNTAKN